MRRCCRGCNIRKSLKDGEEEARHPLANVIEGGPDCRKAIRLDTGVCQKNVFVRYFTGGWNLKSFENRRFLPFRHDRYEASLASEGSPASVSILLNSLGRPQLRSVWSRTTNSADGGLAALGQPSARANIGRWAAELRF